jgi:hypothetical protein
MFLALGLLLVLAIAACAPQAQPAPAPVTPAPAPILIEGGVVEGRFVRAIGLQLALPNPPLAAARAGDKLFAAYPFMLLIYRDGFIHQSLPLPGVPSFVRARPLPLIGFEDRLFVPGLGTLLFRARDALHTPEGVFWLDEHGFNLDRRRLAEGRFTLLAASQRYVYAFGREAFRHPDNLRIPLPGTVRAAVVLDDLYVLTADGIHRLSLEGLRLGFRAGAFEGLKSDDHYLYTLQAGRLLTLRLNLDLADGAGRVAEWARVEGRSLQSPPRLLPPVSDRLPLPSEALSLSKEAP